jgi:hypothetical protein
MVNWLLNGLGGWILALVAVGVLWGLYCIGTLIKSGISYRRYLHRMRIHAQKVNPRLQPNRNFSNELARANRHLLLGAAACGLVVVIGAIIARGDILITTAVAIGVTITTALGYRNSTITIRDSTTKKEVAV